MAMLSLALRTTVALVCLTAAVGKVRSRSGYRDFIEFLTKAAVPAPVAGRVGAAIVAAELAVAALAPWPVTGWLGAAGGTALFAVFAVAVRRAVASGRVPPCRCFGTAGMTLSRSHVVRNAWLTAVGLCAVLATLAAPPAWPRPTETGLALLAAAVLTVTVLSWEDVVSVLFDDVIPARTTSKATGHDGVVAR